MAVDVKEVIKFLNIHRQHFEVMAAFAAETGQPVPCDTRAASQILITLLTGVPGIERKKGPDLSDGSDVKGACTWKAINTPRFNGCTIAGRKGQQGGMDCLDCMPHLYFVMWDEEPDSHVPRCRVWVVRPQRDQVFRAVVAKWYHRRASGQIRSQNFQLHPPRGKNTDVFTNKCGNLTYPLLLCAEYKDGGYDVINYNPNARSRGECKAVDLNRVPKGKLDGRSTAKGR